MRWSSEDGRILRTLALSLFLIVFNGLAFLQLIGIGGWDGSWEQLKAQAQTYYHGGTDTDGDGVVDVNDPRPTFNDASGCFYELGTGEIIPGGSVTDSFVNDLVNDDGADGCFQYVHQGDTLHELSVNPPLGWVVAATCRPPFEGCPAMATCSNGGLQINPTGVVVVGALVDTTNTAFLLSGGCTPFYPQVDVNSINDSILANNIALVRLQLAPAMDVRSLMLLLLLMSAAGWFSIRRLRASANDRQRVG